MAPLTPQRSITLVGASATASCALGPKATKEDFEAHWKTKVTGPAGETATRRTTSLSIAMSGQSLEDARMEHWCAWFSKFVKELFHSESELQVREANFSSNRLSAKGVQQLLSTLRQLRVRVGVLKLFQNELQKADAIVDFILFCEGSLRELHLSHNKLDTAAARDIIFTTAAATRSAGGYAYPRNGSVPLWLRLEGNRCDNGELVRALRAALQTIGRPYEKALCEVDGKSRCCPSLCDQCRIPPAIHITYMKLSEHARNRNMVSASIGRMPPLPAAALKSAATMTAAAKAASPANGAAAAKASPPAAATGAAMAWTCPPCAPSRADESTATAAAKRPATPETAPAVALPAAALQDARPAIPQAPPGLSLPPGLTPKGAEDTPKSVTSAAESTPKAPKEEEKSFSLQDDFPALLGGPGGGAGKAKAAAPAASNWGAKSPSMKAAATLSKARAPAAAKAPTVSKMGEEDFPALPSSGKKGRQTKATPSPKQCQAPEKVTKQSSFEFKEAPTLSRVSTCVSTGDSEQDHGQPEAEPSTSEIQGSITLTDFSDDETPEFSNKGLLSSWELGAVTDTTHADTQAQPISTKACYSEAAVNRSDTKACNDDESSKWTSWIVFETYEAEAPGYLTVSRDEQIQVYEVNSPTEGDPNCGWPAYVFCTVTNTKGLQGWVPLDILAVRYLTDTGRKWLHVPSTQQCCWETEEATMVLQEE